MLLTCETPVGVIELPVVRANIARVVTYCGHHGITWRPHIKTHKSVRLAQLQLAAGAAGLTVATPREAEVMATVTDDLLVAYPVVGGNKLQRLMALPSSVRLMIGLDSSEVLAMVGRAAAAANRSVRVLVEIDAGLGRVGLQTPAEAVRLAGEIRASTQLEYAGILYYPGQIRAHSTTQGADLAVLADLLRSFHDALAAAGLPPSVVSGGSTPTLWRSHEIPGLTEIRPGTCIFFDREGLTIDVAKPGDIAYSVLATVVSTAIPDQAVVDAGSKALAKESRDGADGFGFLLDRPEVLVESLSEEHGILDLSETDWCPLVGDRVRIVPNHVCVSVNLQDYLLAVDGDLVEQWPLEARGRSPYQPTEGDST
ncbi:MAG: D-TA family PLP-dependent enzyme [Gemmatimonadota bacterium]|nr:MAG: D-TA family PLP-dependent enzyme [Gemmatimonadota bacterium]